MGAITSSIGKTVRGVSRDISNTVSNVSYNKNVAAHQFDTTARLAEIEANRAALLNQQYMTLAKLQTLQNANVDTINALKSFNERDSASLDNIGNQEQETRRLRSNNETDIEKEKEKTTQNKHRLVAETVQNVHSETMKTARHITSEAASTVKHITSEAASTVKHITTEVTDTIDHAIDKTSETVNHAVDAVQDLGNNAIHTVGKLGTELVHTTEKVLTDPNISAGIGKCIGNFDINKAIDSAAASKGGIPKFSSNDSTPSASPVLTTNTTPSASPVLTTNTTPVEFENQIRDTSKQYDNLIAKYGLIPVLASLPEDRLMYIFNNLEVDPQSFKAWETFKTSFMELLHYPDSIEDEGKREIAKENIRKLLQTPGGLESFMQAATRKIEGGNNIINVPYIPKFALFMVFISFILVIITLIINRREIKSITINRLNVKHKLRMSNINCECQT